MKACEFKLSQPVEFKFAADSGLITGYGSTYNNVDHGGDIVAPGAFAKSLAEHKADGSMPAMLWSHDISQPVGVWTSAVEDQKGLRLEGKLSLGVQRAADARALAKDNALSLSIGYATRDAEYRDGARVLKDLRLFEVSLVSIPMNPRAQITSIKSSSGSENVADEIRDAVAFEKFLKQHGFANSFARRLVAGGWHNATKGHERDADVAELVAFLHKSATNFQSN
jgi:HK97 family phage prohead protease